MKNVILSLFCILCIASCSKDPCKDIVCSNGDCINGVCDCDTGYEGPSCANQQEPSTIRINRVRILKFPSTDDNGGGWDVWDGADLFFQILFNGNVIYTHNSRVNNAIPDQTHTFTPSTNLNLYSVNDKYVIRLWDYDDFDNDLIASWFFYPYQSNNGFPPVYTIGGNSDPVHIEFDFSYQF